MKITIKKYLVAVVLSVVSLTSCLDDSGYLDIYNAENNGAVVSFFGNNHGLYSTSIDYVVGYVNLSLVKLNVARAVGDVTVSLKLDTAALGVYNREQIALADKNKTEYNPYELLPDSTYSFINMTVTIPKGTLDYGFPISINADKISFDYNYVLPLTIESISGDAVLAENLKTSLLNVSVKNNYDGLYTVTGVLSGHPSVSGDILFEKLEYFTVGQFTNIFWQPYGKGGSQFGVQPAVTVNSDNYVTIGTGSESAAAIINQNSNSRYFPETKTFHLGFGWGARMVKDTLVYTGPR